MLSLPADILILILETLSVPDLTSLSLTCHDLHSIVTSYGWPAYLRANTRPSYSLSRVREIWTPHKQARYDSLTDHAWSKPKFIARPLSRPWSGKLQPVLAISSSRLVIGAGSNIYSYAFGVPKPNEKHRVASPPTRYEGSVSMLFATGTHPLLEDRPRSITAIAFVPDGGRDVVLDVAFLDGALERVVLRPPAYSTLFDSDTSTASPILQMSRTNLTPMPQNDFIESLSIDSARSIILALASNGVARLSRIPRLDNINIDDPISLSSLSLSHTQDSPVSHISLGSRSWKSLLSLSSPHPYAAFGSSSNTPLVVHSITDGGIFDPIPSAVLHTRGVVAKLDKIRSNLSILEKFTAMQATLRELRGLNQGGTDIPNLNANSNPNILANGSMTSNSVLDTLPSSAVYGLTHAPYCAPWGASSQVLISGWFDGEVRIYDLRSGDRFGWNERSLIPRSNVTTTAVASAAIPSTSTSTPLRSSTPATPQTYQVPLLKPSLTLSDRWSDEPIYAVSAGGGNGACVAAGTGRHSVVAMFDVRVGGGTEGMGSVGTGDAGVVSAYTNAGGGGMSGRWGREPATDADAVEEGDTDTDEGSSDGLMKGWSVHAPGNDQSPVYDVIMENDRVWGVTQARGFVFDFSPNVSPTTYPAFSLDSSLKMRGRKGAGVQVVKYLHREGRWVD